MRTIGSSSLAVETGAPVMLNHRGEPMVPTRRVLKSQSLPPPSATLYGASGRGYDLRQRASKKRSARKFSALMEDDPELLAILYPIKKKQRSDNSSAADLFDSGASDAPLHVATPFDEHLRAIYDGQADDGLAFFESHGYYDVDDANTVEMFRKNFDLDSTGFWVDRYGRHRLNSSSSSSQDSADLEHDEFSLSSGSSAASECFNTDINPFVGSFVRSASMRVMSSRRQPHSSTRGRSASRFALLDDEGNEVDYDLDQDEEFEDEDDEIERMARELRLKARSLAMDADDVAELERDQRAMVRAVAVIRSEKSQLQRLLFEAFANGEAVTVTINGVSPTIQFPTLRTMNATPPPPSIPQSVQPAAVDVESLPPYCGNVHVLRDSVPFLLGSGWRKRWFCLDFQEGVVTMFKRSYWKAPRGALDLRGVARIEKMGRADFRIEFLPHSSDCEPAVLMLRAKNAEDADMWVSLLRFARRNVRLSSASAGSSERALVIAKQKTSGHNNHANNNAKKGNKQVDMYTRILEMANQQQLRPSLPSSTAVARSSLTA